MADQRPIIIGVIGAGKCNTKLHEEAYLAGAEIARNKAVLVCGGLAGVMEAAAMGAHEAGGITIGILPGNNKDLANPYIDYVIPTGIGEARNAVVVNTADAILAMPGRYGTITEIAFAIKSGKTIVSPYKWDAFPELEIIPDIKLAVARLIESACRG